MLPEIISIEMYTFKSNFPPLIEFILWIDLFITWMFNETTFWKRTKIADEIWVNSFNRNLWIYTQASQGSNGENLRVKITENCIINNIHENRPWSICWRACLSFYWPIDQCLCIKICVEKNHDCHSHHHRLKTNW